MNTQNKIEEHLDSFGNKLKSVKEKHIQAIIVGALITAMIILIWGYFHAIAEVPWPKETFPEFPGTAYQSAGKYYKSQKTFEIVDEASMNKWLQESLESGDRYSSGDLDALIAKQLMGKHVLVKPFSKLPLSDTIKNKIKDIKNDFQLEMKQLEKEYENTSYYWEKQRIHRELNALKQRAEQAEKSLSSISKSQLICSLKFPYTGEAQTFNLMVGKFKRVNRLDENTLNLELEEGRPVLSQSFLKKIPKSQYTGLEKQLEKDEDRLSDILSKAKKEYKKQKEVHEDQIRASITPRRSRVREFFYTKWYSILIMTFVSLLMAVLLYLYYTIIRRKGIPKKSTHHVYFATNTTSRILRYMALAIVILGFFVLLINIVLTISSRNIPFAVIRDISFVFGIVTPIWTTLMTVVFSWTFVLWSEFTCFISNCFHVVFIKAYQDSGKKSDMEES